ncbi:MAG: nucleoside-diphosphate kinase [Gemmatimonadales bacterium]|jgi:nucleoside-diphosphate kinase|nr:nucleoside-diphosphate kinase [Gemmatimonadales bacterium]MBP6570482.1 nucleoside-diphosphate kinase [Gemmatimonadales bacterium]MBP7621225.1 nucleoside-diphosphate kinase [Gemmatimonadales bacterium]
MAGKLTFAMLKPDAVAAGNAGAILAHVEKSGFAIKAMRMLRLTRVEAEAFYAVHRERGFYGELVEFMSSGPVVAMALEAPDAVLAWRTAIGATDPAEAAEGTIRKLFAESKGKNAVHGSDSDENAAREIAFFFPERELALLGVV